MLGSLGIVVILIGWCGSLLGVIGQGQCPEIIFTKSYLIVTRVKNTPDSKIHFKTYNNHRRMQVWFKWIVCDLYIAALYFMPFLWVELPLSPLWSSRKAMDMYKL